jgi:hypothetical protein
MWMRKISRKEGEKKGFSKKSLKKEKTEMGTLSPDLNCHIIDN